MVEKPAHSLSEATQLAAALEAQDSAAVAFALRNDIVIVPLLPVDGPAQVRVFRAPGAETNTLLLFSSAGNYVRMVPKEDDHRILPYDRAQLQEFLEKHLDAIDTVWFDVAGPHPMQADPRELLSALAL
ncbi:MAG: uncharacterized protein JWL94_1749 [Microbacteriaceae bacterium]|jgi:hypothetical protein|nr:uncharacterized protein [Microbacteriaceae bacterium]HEV7957543.1 SseB family protein [Marisediminicola sp.]